MKNPKNDILINYVNILKLCEEDNILKIRGNIQKIEKLLQACKCPYTDDDQLRLIGDERILVTIAIRRLLERREEIFDISLN